MADQLDMFASVGSIRCRTCTRDRECPRPACIPFLHLSTNLLERTERAVGRAAGLSSAELGRRLGLREDRARAYLASLRFEGRVLKVDGRWWLVEKDVG